MKFTLHVEIIRGTGNTLEKLKAWSTHTHKDGKGRSQHFPKVTWDAHFSVIGRGDLPNLSALQLLELTFVQVKADSLLFSLFIGPSPI